MAGQTLATVFLAAIFHAASAQFPMFNSGWNLWNNGQLQQQQQGQPQQQQEHAICISKSENGISLVVTFTPEISTPNTGMMWRFFAQPQEPTLTKVKVNVVFEGQSFPGQMEVVATRYGGINGHCNRDSLGEIIENPRRSFWDMFSEPSGVIASANNYASNKVVSIETNSDLDINSLVGSGLAICTGRNGRDCYQMIPVCCAVCRSKYPAEQLLQMQGNNGQVNSGFNNVGVNPVNTGGLNSGGINSGNINSGGMPAGNLGLSF